MAVTPIAFAWDNSDLVELHSEHGFISGSSNSSLVAMNTVMSNGFQTIEEGHEKGNSIRFLLRRIGRINFSRDLPVRYMVRDWTLLNETFLESSVYMATTTHPMMLHTQIIYKKIYP
uniref:THAP4-like heme-binding beta-barrel domain-containing protein n=1 Tax=Panagrolaimus sp. JU765 TaxID=591449 RepID=A0AC34Q7A9_9BILA